MASWWQRMQFFTSESRWFTLPHPLCPWQCDGTPRNIHRFRRNYNNRHYGSWSTFYSFSLFGFGRPRTTWLLIASPLNQISSFMISQLDVNPCSFRRWFIHFEMISVASAPLMYLLGISHTLLFFTCIYERLMGFKKAVRWTEMTFTVFLAVNLTAFEKYMLRASIAIRDFFLAISTKYWHS